MRPAAHLSSQRSSNPWRVVRDQPSDDVRHHKGRRYRLEKDLCLCQFSFKLSLLDKSSSWVSPDLKDDAHRSHLREDIEQAGQPGEVSLRGNLRPEEPGHHVVCQEGYRHHRRPSREPVYIQLLVWDSC